MKYSAPFKKVWVVNEDGTRTDISDIVGGITYTRDVTKENMLTFDIQKRYTDKNVTNIIKRGTFLEFQFGYKGSKRSLIYSAIVVEVKKKYAKEKSITVQARDTSTSIKKTASNKVWKNVTTSDVAKEIALRYGLTFNGDETTYVWESYPQGQKNDWSFIGELVDKDGSGNYIVYIDSNELRLERRGSDKKAAVSYEWGNGTNVISFDVKDQEKKSGSSSVASTTVSGFDPNEKEVVQTDANPETEEANVILGPWKNILGGLTLDASGEKKEGLGGESVFKAIVAAGSRLISPEENKDEISSKANTLHKSGSYTITMGTLKTVGEPSLKLNTVITMQGVDEEDRGNYLIKSITDEIKASGGYTTTSVMQKNAKSRPSSTNKKEKKTTNPNEVNKTTGDSSISTKKEIGIYFGATGNVEKKKKTQYKAPK